MDCSETSNLLMACPKLSFIKLFFETVLLRFSRSRLSIIIEDYAIIIMFAEIAFWVCLGLVAYIGFVAEMVRETPCQYS
jgi:hypothetical protein